MNRGQSHIVGVALMLGLTVVALGALTVGIGTVFEGQAASADAQRVADDVDRALRPVETTGIHSGRVAFSEGRLYVAERQVRIFRNGSLLSTHDVDALVFESGDRRVAFVAGAIVRGTGESAWLERPPPIAVSSADDGVFVLGVPRLNASDVSLSGSHGSTLLETNVSHERFGAGRGTFWVAIETEATGALTTYFDGTAATHNLADVDGDGVPSVLARYPGNRTGYLVEHDMRLEVADG